MGAAGCVLAVRAALYADPPFELGLVVCVVSAVPLGALHLLSLRRLRAPHGATVFLVQSTVSGAVAIGVPLIACVFATGAGLSALTPLGWPAALIFASVSIGVGLVTLHWLGDLATAPTPVGEAIGATIRTLVGATSQTVVRLLLLAGGFLLAAFQILLGVPTLPTMLLAPVAATPGLATPTLLPAALGGLMPLRSALALAGGALLTLFVLAPLARGLGLVEGVVRVPLLASPDPFFIDELAATGSELRFDPVTMSLIADDAPSQATRARLGWVVRDARLQIALAALPGASTDASAVAPLTIRVRPRSLPRGFVVPREYQHAVQLDIERKEFRLVGGLPGDTAPALTAALSEWTGEHPGRSYQAHALARALATVKDADFTALVPTVTSLPPTLAARVHVGLAPLLITTTAPVDGVREGLLTLRLVGRATPADLRALQDAGRELPTTAGRVPTVTRADWEAAIAALAPPPTAWPAATTRDVQRWMLPAVCGALIGAAVASSVFRRQAQRPAAKSEWIAFAITAAVVLAVTVIALSPAGGVAMLIGVGLLMPLLCCGIVLAVTQIAAETGWLVGALLIVGVCFGPGAPMVRIGGWFAGIVALGGAWFAVNLLNDRRAGQRCGVSPRAVLITKLFGAAVAVALAPLLIPLLVDGPANALGTCTAPAPLALPWLTGFGDAFAAALRTPAAATPAAASGGTATLPHLLALTIGGLVGGVLTRRLHRTAPRQRLSHPPIVPLLVGLLLPPGVGVLVGAGGGLAALLQWTHPARATTPAPQTPAGVAPAGGDADPARPQPLTTQDLPPSASLFAGMLLGAMAAGLWPR